jgi:hypothetical protein
VVISLSSIRASELSGKMEEIRRKIKLLKEKVEYKVRQFQMEMDSSQTQLGENMVYEVRELQAELTALEQEFQEVQEFQEQIHRRRK